MSCSDAAKAVRDIATDASTALEPSVVGTWKTTMFGYPRRFTFNSDGTYVEYIESWLGSRHINGHYTLLDNARLKVTTPGDLWGTHDITWSYSISDDTLTLTHEAVGTLRCTRL